MIPAPLTLEALALRRVIKERGIQDDFSDLVPRMRQELKELARLPGEYQIVDIQMDLKKEEDGEFKNLPHSDKTSDLIGGRISVSCATGSSWTVQVQEGPVNKFSLGGETVAKDEGVTHFREIFVEDGALKSMSWGRRDVEEKNKDEVRWDYRLNSLKLDHRGALTWTGHSSHPRETLWFTIRTKRFHNAKSSLEMISRLLLNALTPLGGALLVWYAFGI